MDLHILGYSDWFSGHAAAMLQPGQKVARVVTVDRNRYLVACRDGGIDPVVILSKTDLLTPKGIAARVLDLRDSGMATQIIPVSSATGDGLEQFRALLKPGQTCCFVGSSGVGKSTLINRMMGRNELETSAVSATGEGTHTTSRRQLLLLDNGTMLIDTPGMRELGLMGTGDGLDDSFSDVRELSHGIAVGMPGGGT